MSDEMTIDPMQDLDAQGKRKLAIGGALTIAHAAELRLALLEALEETDELHLDLSGATEMDLTALQLLWAARKSAARLGKSVLWGGSSEVCRRVAAASGFDCLCVE